MLHFCLDVTSATITPIPSRNGAHLIGFSASAFDAIKISLTLKCSLVLLLLLDMRDGIS